MAVIIRRATADRTSAETSEPRVFYTLVESGLGVHQCPLRLVKRPRDFQFPMTSSQSSRCTIYRRKIPHRSSQEVAKFVHLIDLLRC